jgi:hypothetical protein
MERLYILKILALFEQLPMKLDADHREYEECDVINIMLTAEEVPVNLQDYRDKVLQLRKLNVLFGSERVPEFYFEAICRTAFGTCALIYMFDLNRGSMLTLISSRTLDRQLPTTMG